MRNLLQLSPRHLSTATATATSTYELNTQLKHLIQSNRLPDARQLFDITPHRKDQITWTTLIKAYLNANNPLESLSLFSHLHSTSDLIADQFILSLALKASSTSPSLLPLAKSIHSHSLKMGALPSSVFVATALLDMYSRNDGGPAAALKVFDEMPVKNVVSWTAVVNALVRAGRCHDAVRCFASMRRRLTTQYCDSHTYATVFKACTDANLVSRGKEVHSIAIKMGFHSSSFVANTLATMYSKCGDLAEAVLVFEQMQTMHNRDVVSWTSVIATYLQMGREEDAVGAFITMQDDGVRPNEHTYAEVLSGVTATALGEQLHGQAARAGFISATTVANTLISFYSRAGRLSSADRVFREIYAKDIVSFSSIISAYSREGYTEESFVVFAQMTSAGILPTEYQVSSLLGACAAAAMLDAGRQVHALTIAIGVGSDPKINSGLISMYSKCGTIEEACKVFGDHNETGVEQNVVSWTALVNGYAEHGLSKEAIEMFDRMVRSGVVPDEVAYMGVLSACSHAGLVDMGVKYLERMQNEDRLEAWREHYGCVVDMLGRAGRLKEAVEMIETMSMSMSDGDEVVWTAVLRACGVHGDTELGERAAQRVLELDPECAGAHIALSNMYAAQGRWADAALARRRMRGRGVRKEAGWSWVGAGDGSVSVFTSGDTSHSRDEDIYQMLGLLYFEAKQQLLGDRGNF